MRNQITKEAIEKAGGFTALAKFLKCSVPTVHNWNRVPAERCMAVSKMTGIPLAKLRPDVFPTGCQCS